VAWRALVITEGGGSPERKGGSRENEYEFGKEGRIVIEQEKKSMRCTKKGSCNM